MSNAPRIYLSPPHMGGEEQAMLADAFASNWIAPLGPHVDAFERETAAKVGVKGALALSSGTAALHLSLKLLGLRAGDTVFCSSLTFSASANPILYEGATPVFIDSEPDSWNMSPAALERAFAEAKKAARLPRAVIVVGVYGQCADMDAIVKICESHGVPVIEDAAEAFGATYKGRAAGSCGRFGILSFNGNKIITTSGGGMLLSDDTAALEKARFWATQARDKAPHYQHSELGYNYRLSNLLAAVGRAQLKVLDQRVKARRAIFERYRAALGDIQGLSFMPEARFGQGNRWLSVVTMEPSRGRPLDLLALLEKHNIESRPVWKPMHLQPLFAGAKYYSHSPNESVCDALFERGLCLPSGSSLTVDQQARVIELLRQRLLA